MTSELIEENDLDAVKESVVYLYLCRTIYPLIHFFCFKSTLEYKLQSVAFETNQKWLRKIPPRELDQVLVEVTTTSFTLSHEPPSLLTILFRQNQRMHTHLLVHSKTKVLQEERKQEVVAWEADGQATMCKERITECIREKI